jgi:hypothetical protein
MEPLRSKSLKWCATYLPIFLLVWLLENWGSDVSIYLLRSLRLLLVLVRLF